MTDASLRITRSEAHLTIESNRRTFGLSLEAAREFRDALSFVLDTPSREFQNETYRLLNAASVRPVPPLPPSLADLLGI